MNIKSYLLIALAILALSLNSMGQKLNEVNHFSMDTLPWEKLADKIYRKFAYGSNGMIAYLRLEKGAYIGKHNHPNEQITHILEGKVEVIIDDISYIVGKGEVLIIPPNKSHSFRALETTLDMDVFAPIRQDWINKTENYFSKELPKRELITVATLEERPGNVNVTVKGEVYSTLHPMDNPSRQLIRIGADQSIAPFPNSKWQRKANEKATASTFDTPLGITSDSKGNIWVIDMGQNIGITRLFSFSPAGKKLFDLSFPAAVAPKGSFIQDLAVDDINGFVYLADINNPGIVVVNIFTKEVYRLKQHSSFLAENVDMVIDKKLIYFGGSPARVAINPITLSADKETLFYGAMNGTHWYALPTKLIRTKKDDATIAAAIKVFSKKPVSDGGASTTANGNHYFTNINEKGIDVWRSTTRTLEPLVRDERLDWPDNVSVSKDGYLYVTVNQLYKAPPFTGGKDNGKAPYFIYKIKLDE